MFAARLFTGKFFTSVPGSVGSNVISRSNVKAKEPGTISSSLTYGKSTYKVSPGFAVGGEKVVT